MTIIIIRTNLVNPSPPLTDRRGSWNRSSIVKARSVERVEAAPKNKTDKPWMEFQNHIQTHYTALP